MSEFILLQMNRFISFLILLAVFTTVGCDRLPKSGRTIGVRVTANETKGTVTTTSSLLKAGEFCMCAYIDEEYSFDENTDFTGHIAPTGNPGLYFGSLNATTANVIQSAGTWGISGSPLWIAGTPIRFWSWHPVSTVGTRTIYGPVDGTAEKSNFDGEALSFSYEIPTPDGISDADDAASEDLLFAFTKDSYDADDLFIDVTFHHALAQVRFCISTDDGTFDAHSLGIKNISISDLRTSGNCKFSGPDASFIWTNLTGSATIGQDYDVTDFLSPSLAGWASGTYTKDDNAYSLLTNTNVFFMIPQTLSGHTGATDDNKISIVFLFGSDEITKTVTLPEDTWDAEHYYTYKIKATTVGRDIDVSVNLVGWSDRDDKLFI